MFFCEDCRAAKGWPESIGKSMGTCEMCHKTAPCYDVPSKRLPKPKTHPLLEPIADLYEDATCHMQDCSEHPTTPLNAFCPEHADLLYPKPEPAHPWMGNPQFFCAEHASNTIDDLYEAEMSQAKSAVAGAHLAESILAHLKQLEQLWPNVDTSICFLVNPEVKWDGEAIIIRYVEGGGKYPLNTRQAVLYLAQLEQGEYRRHHKLDSWVVSDTNAA